MLFEKLQRLQRLQQLQRLQRRPGVEHGEIWGILERLEFYSTVHEYLNDLNYFQMVFSFTQVTYPLRISDF